MKKYLVQLMIIGVLVISVSIVAAQSTPSAGNALTTAVIQNTSTGVGEDATVVVSYYDTAGTLVYTNSGMVIGPKSVQEVSAGNEPLPAGFQGSAVVSSDRPVAAIVSVKYTNVPADPDGKAQAAYNGSSSGATTLYFPSLWQFSGIVSTFTVQNTEATVATVQVEWFDRNGTALDTETGVTIPAYSSKTWDLASDAPANFPNDGSVIVTSTSGEGLAGASTAIYPQRAGAYPALTDANKGTLLYAPSQFKFKSNPLDAKYAIFSAINLQNTSTTTDATVQIRYYNRDTGALDLQLDRTIPPATAIGLNTKEIPTFDALGTDWDGSVIIESTNSIPLVGTLVTVWEGQEKAGIAYLATANDAADTLFLPAQYRLKGISWNQWSSLNLQNIGTTTVAASDLTIEYVDNNGVTVDSFTGAELPVTELAPGAALGLNTRGPEFTDAVFGTDFIGGIMVTGPVGSELIATANIVYSNRSSVYNAFSGN